MSKSTNFAAARRPSRAKLMKGSIVCSSSRRRFAWMKLHIDLGDRGHQLRALDSAVEREAHGDPFDDAVGVAAVVELQRQEELRPLLGPSARGRITSPPSTSGQNSRVFALLSARDARAREGIAIARASQDVSIGSPKSAASNRTAPAVAAAPRRHCRGEGAGSAIFRGMPHSKQPGITHPPERSLRSAHGCVEAIDF